MLRKRKSGRKKRASVSDRVAFLVERNPAMKNSTGAACDSKKTWSWMEIGDCALLVRQQRWGRSAFVNVDALTRRTRHLHSKAMSLATGNVAAPKGSRVSNRVVTRPHPQISGEILEPGCARTAASCGSFSILRTQAGEQIALRSPVRRGLHAGFKIVQRRPDLAAERGRTGDQGNGNQGGDQAVFDSGRTGLIPQETVEKLGH